jgi:PPOX class probable F420-dependent enzyme
VEAIEPGSLLRLRAEMKLPGLAWLELSVGQDPDGLTTYRQRAIFRPRGLAGHAYWRSISPFHGVVFGGMLKNITAAAEQAERAGGTPSRSRRYDEPRDRGDQAMSGLPRELRDLIESGPLAHLSTINADGSPQVSVIWIGLDGDDLVSGHMQWYAKLRNIERDPRVVLSFEAPRAPGVFLNPYAVLHARAAIEPGDDAWNLLDRLTKVYMSPDTDFPAPKGPGYLVRYSVERIGGVGPWVPASH